jgi:hypothetical protein
VIVSASDCVEDETYCRRCRFDDVDVFAGILIDSATVPVLFEAGVMTGVCGPTEPPPHAASRAESDVRDTSVRVDDIVMPFIDDHAIE